MARKQPDPVQESPDQLADQLEDLLESLSDTIDELVDRVKPANIVKRQADRAKRYFVDETGPRYEHIVPVVTGVAATIAGIVVLRKLLK